MKEREKIFHRHQLHFAKPSSTSRSVDSNMNHDWWSDEGVNQTITVPKGNYQDKLRRSEDQRRSTYWMRVHEKL